VARDERLQEIEARSISWFAVALEKTPRGDHAVGARPDA
jgi:hypothetical protein